MPLSFEPAVIQRKLYYYPLLSRAATILWGRLATCGGLSIRLPAASTMPENRPKSLRLPLCGPANPGSRPSAEKPPHFDWVFDHASA
jgi:hypothetical protein